MLGFSFQVVEIPMSFRHLSLLAAAALAGGLLSACNEQALPQAPGVGASMAPVIAVVDVDAVAHALGRDVSMREQLTSASEELSSEVRGLAQELKHEFRPIASKPCNTMINRITN